MLSIIITLIIVYLVLSRLRRGPMPPDNDHSREGYSDKDEYYWYDENAYEENDYGDDRPLSGPWNRTNTGDDQVREHHPQPIPVPSRPAPAQPPPPKPVVLPTPDATIEGYGYDWHEPEEERIPPRKQEQTPTKPAPKRPAVTPAPAPILPVVSRHKTWSAANPLTTVLSGKNALLGSMIVGEILSSRGGRSGRGGHGANKRR